MRVLFLRLPQEFASPVATYKNKWVIDWVSHWFYHKVPQDPAMKSHSLVVRHIGALDDVPKVAADARPEDEAFLAMLQKVSKTFSTRDIIEEFMVGDCLLTLTNDHFQTST